MSDKGGDDMETILKSKQCIDLQEDVRKLMKSEMRLNAKKGKILLDKNNPKHVEFFEDRG